MTTMEISEARQTLTSIDGKLQATPIIHVTRHGKNVFAIVEIAYLETIMETISILSDPQAMKDLQESLDDIKHRRLIDHEAVMKEFEEDDASGNDSMD